MGWAKDRLAEQLAAKTELEKELARRRIALRPMRLYTYAGIAIGLAGAIWLPFADRPVPPSMIGELQIVALLVAMGGPAWAMTRARYVSPPARIVEGQAFCDGFPPRVLLGGRGLGQIDPASVRVARVLRRRIYPEFTREWVAITVRPPGTLGTCFQGPADSDMVKDAMNWIQTNGILVKEKDVGTRRW